MASEIPTPTEITQLCPKCSTGWTARELLPCPECGYTFPSKPAIRVNEDGSEYRPAVQPGERQ